MATELYDASPAFRDLSRYSAISILLFARVFDIAMTVPILEANSIAEQNPLVRSLAPIEYVLLNGVAIIAIILLVEGAIWIDRRQYDRPTSRYIKTRFLAYGWIAALSLVSVVWNAFQIGGAL